MDQPILHDSKHLPCWSVLEQDIESLPAPERRPTIWIIILSPPLRWTQVKHKFRNKYSPLVINAVSCRLLITRVDTLISNSSITHHIDGIYWTDAVDKHVCVDHCRFDCKEAQENPFKRWAMIYHALTQQVSGKCSVQFISFVYIITIFAEENE